MPTPPEPTLGDDLSRVIKLFHAARQSLPWAHPDVDPMHYPVMFLIWGGTARVSDLAARLHADVSTLSRQVSTLTAAGLVTRGTDPNDRRAQVLELTEAGKQMLLQLRAQRDGWLDRVLADWQPQERATFAALMARFVIDLQDDLQR